MPALRRVGHKGADLIAPGNTFASFEAAVAAGVDMIEFDVLPERSDGTGELFLAHDYKDLNRRRDSVVTLEQGLDHLCGTGLDLDVDLKIPGYEARVIAALREREVLPRVLVSTMEKRSLRTLRMIAPEVRLGWSIPNMKADPFKTPALRAPAWVLLQAARRVVPYVTARAIRAGRVDAIMANDHLVTPALARAIAAAGGELYVWTVDRADRIAALEKMGVTGVITNDPRLFGGLMPESSAA
jgi:glycerophosphoryl diester phosphodiesterase